MTTLVIHAPDARVKRTGAKSFEAVLADGIGKGYILSPREVSKLHPGCTVVLLRKDGLERRAEGRLVRPIPTIKTPRGKQRYDVHIKDLKEVYNYKPEKLNRFGVAVIGDC
jgi:hypothetical protein